MKIVKNLAFLLIATLLVGFSFTSCSEDDDDYSKSDLVGTWQLVSGKAVTKLAGQVVEEWPLGEEGLHTITLNQDGTFISYSEEEDWYGDIEIEEDEGTWSLKGNKLTLISDDEDEDPETAKITKLTSSTLVLEQSEKGKYEGISYEYNRKQTFIKILD